MRHFSWEQTLGHKQVHNDRLLVVTDSPYLSPNRHVSFNIPGLIGDVAELVAARRMVNLPDFWQSRLRTPAIFISSAKGLAWGEVPMSAWNSVSRPVYNLNWLLSYAISMGSLFLFKIQLLINFNIAIMLCREMGRFWIPERRLLHP